jgi:hypothetical protein
MPSKSARQHRLMALAANDKSAAKRLGVPQSVAREFMEEDKGKKFPSKRAEKAERRYGKK